MGYPTWRSNTNSIHVGQVTVGAVPGLAGPSTTIIDNLTLKADKSNQGIIYVSIQDAVVTQRFALYAGDSLSNMRVSSFETFRVYASVAGQVLWVYAELPSGVE